LVHLKALCRKRRLLYSRAARRWELQMLDLIMLAIGLAFFALSVGYTIACDRL